ncbi:hypothetical protein ACQV2W_03600 [Facklamia sp. P12934]|uniref:hypothetical protein n=1 Tax=Facklamia sp. P12934 TaxID=3421948 RepID=UPI003D16DB88
MKEPKMTTDAKKQALFIREAYKRQLKRYNRSNLLTSKLIKSINKDKPIEQALVDAIDLIGVILNDTATHQTLKNKIKEAYNID